MLLKGLNHVAVITNDASRLNDFYTDVFDAEILRDGAEPPGSDGPRLSIIKIGDWAELNVFQMEGNTEADRQVPMFGRGRLDHLALQAASLPDFEEIRRRLVARGAADDFVTDFGPMLSLFFRDPDGLECEVLRREPRRGSGHVQPAGHQGGAVLLSGSAKPPVDDIEAIKQLKARYFRTMDTKDWAGMRRVFADDVVMDTTASGGGVVSGADEFLEFLQQTLADAVTVHQGHMPEITAHLSYDGHWYLGAARRHRVAGRHPHAGRRPLSRDLCAGRGGVAHRVLDPDPPADGPHRSRVLGGRRAECRRDLVDCGLLGFAHILTVLPVGGRDSLRQRDDEAAIFVRPLPGSTWSPAAPRRHAGAAGVLLELLGGVVVRVVPLGLCRDDGVEELALAVLLAGLHVGLGHGDGLAERSTSLSGDHDQPRARGCFEDQLPLLSREI